MNLSGMHVLGGVIVSERDQNIKTFQIIAGRVDILPRLDAVV
jgi:hypothetical protein